MTSRHTTPLTRAPWFRAVATGLTAALVVGLGQVPALAADPAPDPVSPPTVQQPSKPVKTTGTKVEPRNDAALTKLAVNTSGRAAFPAAGSARIAAGGGSATIGGMKVAVAPGAVALGGQAGQSAAVQVQVLGRPTAQAAKIDGVVLRLSGVDSESGGRRVTVDYSSFLGGYGANFGARLTLVRLPECALSTPDLPGCAPVPLAATNDTEAQTVTAEVVAERPAGAKTAATGGASGHLRTAGYTAQDATSTRTVTVADEQTSTLLALTSSETSAQGTFAATPLAASSSWSTGLSSGNFSWSYPMRVPPVPGALSPSVALSYSAQSVDGQTSSTNNQGSWIGTGFSYEPGYVERRYKSCDDDGQDGKSDLCWGTDNATLMLGSRSTELVFDDDTDGWRPADDDGTLVERITGGDNTDNNGESWKVTTTDGIQYYFGLNRLTGFVSGNEETDSVWTTPIFGDDSGEPCHDATFAASWCQQAWRWNLDYVVDPHGNAMSFFYGKETNYYARNGDVDVDGTAYVRGGYLKRIDYGVRDGSAYAGTAPARVLFTTAERCLPTSTFSCADDDLTDDTASRWPDLPWDMNCAAETHCEAQQGSPTFWTRKRLTTVTTQILSKGSYIDVDEWSLGHLFTDNGDDSQSLWLSTITHTGRVDGDATLPAVQLLPEIMENRVDIVGDGIAAMARPRLRTVYTDSGAAIDVNYTAAQCDADDLPTPGKSTERCFPVKWNPPGVQDPITDWFHKYVVHQVVQTDRTGGGDDMVTEYEYVGDAAWHYNTPDGLTDSDYLTWGQWRGYRTVRVRGGDGAVMSTRTDYTFLQGMDGDKDPDGGTRAVTVSDSTDVSYTDRDEWAGFQLESIVYDGSAIVSKTITEPWRHRTATRTRDWGTDYATIVRSDVNRTYTALAAGGWRYAKTANTFDTTFGRVTKTEDFGEVGLADDNRCTTLTYADNPAAWMYNFVAETKIVAVDCDTTPDLTTQLLTDSRTLYDGSSTLGGAPTKGDATTTQQLLSHNGTTATFVDTARTVYDDFGRPTKITNAKNVVVARTTYLETGGLTTSSTATNALGHATTTDYAPAWGTVTGSTDPNGKRTDLVLDPLGRLVQVYLPDRGLSGGLPNLRYTYVMQADTPVSVKTETLKNDETYTVGYQIYDGMLRPRQAQSEGPEGGRLITDVFYDGLGRTKKTYDAHYATGSPEGTLAVVASGSVDGQHQYLFDGAGRTTADIFFVGITERWRTTTTYGGDRVNVDPPSGATATTTINDLRGNTTELWQYTGGAPTGTHDVTRYTYTPAGNLASMTDPTDKTWTYEYDQRGRKTSSTDPDSGTTRFTYNELDQPVTTTDARNITLTTTYDDLGRKTNLYQGDTSGTQRATWVYDTVAKGYLYYNQRIVSSTEKYTVLYATRDSFYRPLTTRYGIPAAQGALAKTYAFTANYNTDGSLRGIGMPAAGDLTGEAVTYSYDDLQRLTAVTGNETLSGGYLYANTGELLQLQASTGTVKTWNTFEYETGTDRLARNYLKRSTNANNVTDLAYKYDDAGNVTSVADTPAGATADIQCFNYDYLDRLTQAYTTTSTAIDPCADAPTASTTGGPAPNWHSYTYGNDGSRLTETINPTAASTTKTARGYGYVDGTHKLASLTSTTDSSTTTTGYTYDNAGNTTSRPATTGSGTQTLTWDAEGHLATSAENGATTSYLYDADGNRLIRKEPTSTTLYLPGMELKLTASTGAVTCTRYMDLDGGLTAVRTAAGITFLAADPHGTGQTAVDATTAAVTQRRFTPFGTPRGTASNVWITERGFVNGTADTTTGLTHLGAREYDPATGRFISVDPLLDLTDPQQWNGYVYANNSPVTSSDPAGLIRMKESPASTPCWDACQAQITAQYNGDKTQTPTCGSANACERGQEVYNNELRDALIALIDHPDNKTQAGGSCLLRPDLCVGYRNDLVNGSSPVEIAIIMHCAGSPECLQRFGLLQGFMGSSIGDALTPQAKAVFDQFLLALVPLGTVAGGVKKAVSITSCVVQFAAGNSFDPDTPVRMADGSAKAIKDIKVGDEVAATDPLTGETGARAVTALHDNVDTDLADVVVILSDGTEVTIHTTQDHPFWDATTGEWTQAGHLATGDQLRSDTGTPVRVVSIHHRTERRHMLNLTVAGFHTYYVLAGETPILVHNDNGGIDLSNATEVRGRFPVGGALDAGGPANGILYRTQNGSVSNYAVYDADGVILRRVDLVGAAHGGVPTPHVQEFTRNVAPDGRIFPQQSRIATPAGPGDLPRVGCL